MRQQDLLWHSLARLFAEHLSCRGTHEERPQLVLISQHNLQYCSIVVQAIFLSSNTSTSSSQVSWASSSRSPSVALLLQPLPSESASESVLGTRIRRRTALQPQALVVSVRPPVVVFSLFLVSKTASRMKLHPFDARSWLVLLEKKQAKLP